ncbi:TPA: hypothetical protein NH841_006367, partial [Pseudomonas aeruginosa]|nr:hypothetical protein [Pseudomonas aeruginosa]
DRFAFLLLIPGFRFLNADGSLDELEVALQIVLSQVTSQRDDFAALLIPGAE